MVHSINKIYSVCSGVVANKSKLKVVFLKKDPAGINFIYSVCY